MGHTDGTHPTAMSLSAHARSLARLFLDANAFRFASGDVHAEPGRARLLYAPLPTERAADGLLPSALLLRLAADATGLAAGTLVWSGVRASRLSAEVLDPAPVGLVVVALAGRAAPSPSVPRDAVQVSASVDAEGGPTLARLHGLYVPAGRPLRAPAVTDVAPELVLTRPSPN